MKCGSHVLVGEEQKEIVSSVLAVLCLWDVLISFPICANSFTVCYVLDLTFHVAGGTAEVPSVLSGQQSHFGCELML